MSDRRECLECHGVTIMFHGKGLNSQYRVCGRWQEPGHLTEEEINRKLHDFRLSIRPSGRFA